MSVKVKCTECGKVLAAPDAARGKAIKCPHCQTKIAVPAEEAQAKSVSKSPAAKASKTKAKKSADPMDSEASLMAFDMSRAEAKDARICPKCGFDMKYQDEEDNECSQCGFDTTVGGLGTRARKKAMKGPDPSDFYPGLIKDATKFLGRNKSLAFRTITYTVVCLLLAELFAFLFLWMSMWPTRVFLGLCFLISFLVIPGWMWVLDTEVIKLTLERKEKFKKLNFDFFLSSAMGTAFVIWCAAIVVPLGLISFLTGYLAVKYGHSPQYVQTIFNIVGLIPGISVLPVCMAHMTMPVQYRGWQFWHVARISFRTIKALSYCLLWFLITNIPNIAGATVIGVLYGSEIVNLVGVMEGNADINRAKFAIEENPNAKLKKKGADPTGGKSDAEKQREKLEALAKTDLGVVNYNVLIVPGVILLVMSVVNGFTCMINMRIHGQFTYYNKGSLDLIDRAKEYKYVAKEKVDEDEEAMKPKKVQQLIVDAFAFVMIFDLLGGIGGMLMASTTGKSMGTGIFLGLCLGHGFCMASSGLKNIILAFKDTVVWGLISWFTYPIGFIVWVFKNWEERKGPFIQVIFVHVIWAILLIVGSLGGFFNTEDEEGIQPSTALPAAAAPNTDPGAVANPGGAVAPNQASPPAGPPPQ